MQVISLILFMISLSDSVFGQLMRSFPMDSKLGKLTEFAYPEVIISGQPMHIGAGGQIRDKNNYIILPTILNETGFVRYQLDIMGNVYRIWFLTSEEAEQAKLEEKSRKKWQP